MLNKQQKMLGFTLLEVIVVTVLVSLIMMGLISALGTLGTTATRLEQRVGQVDDIWQVSEFLRFSLSRSVSRLKHTQPDGNKAVFFHGTSEELVWLGVMPARYGAGGLYYFRLAPEVGGTQLVLKYAPYRGDELPDIAEAGTHVLVEQLVGIQIEYQGRRTEAGKEGSWSQVWEDSEQLPVRIRIDITAENQQWPPVFISILATDTSSSGEITGGPQEE